jgi:hypothetical protein
MGLVKVVTIMKNIKKFVKNLFSKFDLIANLTAAKNLSIHQQLIVF